MPLKSKEITLTMTRGYDDMQKLLTPGRYQLVYGNPWVEGNRSMAIKADNIVHAVVLVLGGCDSIIGAQYKVGALYGHVELID